MMKRLKLPEINGIPLEKIPELDVMVADFFDRRAAGSVILHPGKNSGSTVWIPIANDTIGDLKEQASFAESEIRLTWERWDSDFSRQPWLERGPLDPFPHLKTKLADAVARLMVISEEVQTVEAALRDREKVIFDKNEIYVQRQRQNPDGHGEMLDGIYYLDGHPLTADRMHLADTGESVKDHLAKVNQAKNKKLNEKRQRWAEEARKEGERRAQRILNGK